MLRYLKRTRLARESLTHCCLSSDEKYPPLHNVPSLRVAAPRGLVHRDADRSARTKNLHAEGTDRVQHWRRLPHGELLAAHPAVQKGGSLVRPPEARPHRHPSRRPAPAHG